MAGPVDVIGIGADGPAGLKPGLVQRVRAADFLAGGERHLSYFPDGPAERFVIKNNVGDLLAELGRRFRRQRCVVLASGDPLFYGIGTKLLGSLGIANVRIEPAVSAMQLAFARASLSWEAAALASVHGRDLRTTLLPLLGRPLIGLFTHDGDSPAQVARFFLSRGAHDYEAMVAENLGAAAERVTPWLPLERLADQRCAALNYLILRRQAGADDPDLARRRALAPGIPDEEFLRPDAGPEVMTRQEVRAVLIARLGPGPAPGAPLWDIGAGLGTVAVEAALLRPEREVLAVEKDPQRAELLRRNCARFQTYNIRVIAGRAPEALAAEAERPGLVFVGGSGGRLAPLLDFIADRLLDDGRLVANFVTLEHLALTLDRLKAWGWPFGVTEVHVARGDVLAGLTGLKPQRGVFIVSADKRGPDHA